MLGAVAFIAVRGKVVGQVSSLAVALASGHGTSTFSSIGREDVFTLFLEAPRRSEWI
jgi:hypothetical protein